MHVFFDVKDDNFEHINVYVFQVRRRVRPLFLSSQLLKFIYDSITFVATRIAIAYLGFPFLVLELHLVLEIYRLSSSLLLAESDVWLICKGRPNREGENVESDADKSGQVGGRVVCIQLLSLLIWDTSIYYRNTNAPFGIIVSRCMI